MTAEKLPPCECEPCDPCMRTIPERATDCECEPCEHCRGRKRKQHRENLLANLKGLVLTESRAPKNQAFAQVAIAHILIQIAEILDERE